MKFQLAALAAVLVSTVGPASSAEQPAPATNDQKMLYQWGAAIADELANVGANDPEELRWIFRGMSDRVYGRSPAYTSEDLTRLTNYLLARIEKNGVAEEARSVAYLKEKAKEPKAIVTKSGLVYREILAGKGARPAKDATVTVAYAGKLRNGWVFDSSRQRGSPLQMSLKSVIGCWQEAIPMMKVGGKSVITCPPGLAYGANGTNNIPPGAALTFDVELLDVAK